MAALHYHDTSAMQHAMRIDTEEAATQSMTYRKSAGQTIFFTDHVVTC